MPTETETTALTGVAALVGAKLINDVCGPSAKYIGVELRTQTEAGVAKIKDVFKRAARLIKERKKNTGQVSPRVLRVVLQDAPFYEDEVQLSYLSGVLASSKGFISRDDRAATYSAAIQSLSSYQLRTHCIVYSSILRATQKPFKHIFQWVLRRDGITICIREADYRAAMDFSEFENPEAIIPHIFIGLQERGLLREGDRVVDDHPRVEPFRFFHPTSFGVELFLWGSGVGDLGFERFTPELLTNISLPFEVTPLDLKLGQVCYG